MEKDPVCGMRVDPEAAENVDHLGKRYHFCSSRCAEHFREDLNLFDFELTTEEMAALERINKQLGYEGSATAPDA